MKVNRENVTPEILSRDDASLHINVCVRGVKERKKSICGFVQTPAAESTPTWHVLFWPVVKLITKWALIIDSWHVCHLFCTLLLFANENERERITHVSQSELSGVRTKSITGANKAFFTFTHSNFHSHVQRHVIKESSAATRAGKNRAEFNKERNGLWSDLFYFTRYWSVKTRLDRLDTPLTTTSLSLSVTLFSRLRRFSSFCFVFLKVCPCVLSTCSIEPVSH